MSFFRKAKEEVKSSENEQLKQKILRLTERAKALIDSDPKLGKCFLQQAHALYQNSFGSKSISGVEGGIVAVHLAYLRKKFGEEQVESTRVNRINDILVYELSDNDTETFSEFIKTVKIFGYEPLGISVGVTGKKLIENLEEAIRKAHPKADYDGVALFVEGSAVRGYPGKLNEKSIYVVSLLKHVPEE